MILYYMSQEHVTRYVHAITLNDNVKQKKQNVFKVYLLCLTVIFFRFITSKNIANGVSIYHKEPRFHLELDSALKAKEDIPSQMQTI